MLAQLRHITRPDRCLFVCVCGGERMSFCLCVAVCWSMYPTATLSCSGDGWVGCSCSQQVLTPEAGPSMSSSPTRPTGIDCWSSAITVCVCVCQGKSPREEERDSHPSCQLFYYVSDWSFSGRQAAWQPTTRLWSLSNVLFWVFFLLFVWLSVWYFCSAYSHTYIGYLCSICMSRCIQSFYVSPNIVIYTCMYV